MDLKDFDYDLPDELIAQYPAAERTGSRMLVMTRDSGRCELRRFTDFVDYMRAGDCLVFNDTRVIPARLYARREGTGGKVELLFLEKLAANRWQCMMKPGRRMQPGGRLEIEAAPEQVIVVEKRREEDGTFEVMAAGPADLDTMIENYGSIPLPPYIQRAAEAADHDRYQTVYARQPGAVAAPTAGLHFTDEVLEQLKNKGVKRANVTLHVGPGTFRPVKAGRVEDHEMHEERFELSPAAAELINDARAQGGRVIAVGTTSVRVLESALDAERTGCVRPQRGRTRLFLHPPKTPTVTDGLLTNFHLPRSTLLMLVATLSSVENVLDAYRLAVHERFRFYSYGDCMLVL